MAQKSSKAQQGAISQISLRFDGGLNYAQSPVHIADNEMTRAINVIYNSQTGTPETRPGTECITASALAHPIQILYYYEKSDVLKWLVCASYGKLYYLDVDHWHEIGSLNDTTTVPSFLTYHTKLLIADGGTNIKTWDGTTYGALADGLKATAITEVSSRVVVNSSTDRDLVTFSAPADETKWNTATEGAVGLRAGFGDNMMVNSFAVFGDDLLVSKRGDAEKRIYRIKTAGLTTDWSVSKLTNNNCAQNSHTFISAFNNAYFVDSNGFKSINGVTEYGDLQVDPIGDKVNTRFQNATCSAVSYIPAYSAIWYMLADRTTACHRVARPGEATRYVFTELLFQQGKINSIVQAGTSLYLAGDNGYLYRLDDSSFSDEVSPGVFESYPTLVTGKQFNFFGGGILRKTSLGLKALTIANNTTAYLRASTSDLKNILLKSFSVLTADTELYDATGYLYDATTELGTISGNAWFEVSMNRVRGTSIQFQIDSESGRFGIEDLQAEVALVGS